MFNLKSVKETVEGMRAKRDELHTKRDDLLKQIHAIRYAPVNRADVRAFVGQWIDTKAAEFDRRLAERVTKLVTGDQPPVQGLYVGFLGACSSDSADAPVIQTMDATMAALFGDQLRLAFERVLMTAANDAEGLPAAERAVQIDQLQSQVRSIEAEIRDLDKQAEDVGIDL